MVRTAANSPLMSSAAEKPGLPHLPMSDLRRQGPYIKGVAVKTAAPAATAEIDPIIVRHDLGKDLLPGQQVHVAGLIVIDAIAVDGDVVVPRRHVTVEGAAGFGDADDRAIQTEIGAGLGAVIVELAVEPDPRLLRWDLRQV